MSAGARRDGAAMIWSLLVIGLLSLAAAGSALLGRYLPTTVIVLRPAETADTGRVNPGLSLAGQARATALVRAIGDVGAAEPVAAVFATRYRNTQETAEPLARHLDLPVQLVDATDPAPLLQRIAEDYRGRLLVVITDADALPGLVRRLLDRARLGFEVGTEPDRLYIVNLPRVGTGRALSVRYGPPPDAPVAGT